MFIESVKPSKHLILGHLFLILPSIFPRIRAFSEESVLRKRWCSDFGVTLGSLYIGAQGCVPVLLKNLHGISCSGTCWPLGVLRFSVGMEAFDEILSINVPWSQEFSVVLMVWT